VGKGSCSGCGRAELQAAGRLVLPREAAGHHLVATQVRCGNIHQDGDGLGRL
jgi:hypothetical protein